MATALPRATGLKIINGLSGSPKGLDLQFQPSIAVISRELDKLGLDIRSTRVPLQRALKQVIIPSIQKNFDVGGRPRWAPLSPLTIERKGDNRKLIKTGALRRQMRYQNNWRITRTFLVLENLPDNVWYGKIHQAGASFGGGGARKALRIVGTGAKSNERQGSVRTGHNIPARPFVMLQPSDERAIQSVFRHWLQERVDRTARRMRA